MSENTMREAKKTEFERLALENEMDITSLNPDGTYADIEVLNAWLWFQDGVRWQAAIAHQNQDAVPIYQFYNTVNGQWLDISKEDYDLHEYSKKRIVFTAPPQPTEVLEYIARLELKLESAKDLLNSFESCSRNNFDNLSWEEVDSINKTFASKPQSQSVVDERAEFEAVIGKPIVSKLLREHTFRKNEGGMYLNDYTESKWMGWQARAQLNTKPTNNDALDAESKVCEWKGNYDNENMPDTYQGKCGIVWTFIEGDLQENDCKFCPRCGGEIVDKTENIL